MSTVALRRLQYGFLGGVNFNLPFQTGTIYMIFINMALELMCFILCVFV